MEGTENQIIRRGYKEEKIEGKENWVEYINIMMKKKEVCVNEYKQITFFSLLILTTIALILSSIQISRFSEKKKKPRSFATLSFSFSISHLFLLLFGVNESKNIMNE